MKPFIIFFLIFTIFTSCSKKTVEETSKKTELKVSEEFIYNFVNQVLLQNGNAKFCENIIDRRSFVDYKGDSVLLTKIDTIFPKKDFVFAKEQYLRGNKFIWKNKLKGKTIIKLDTTINDQKSSEKFWNKIIEEKHCIGYIDMPIFNSEKNIAIVKIGYNCGMLCGAGGTYIYKLNKNKKWYLYLTLDSWVS